MIIRFIKVIIAIITGIVFGLISKNIFYGFLCFLIIWILIRSAFYLFNKQIENKNFNKHSGPFKEMFGPYGQKVLASYKTSKEVRIRLNEVFTSDKNKLNESVKQIEFLQELSKAGLKSVGAEILDLTLAYGKHRIKNIENKNY